MALNLLVRRWVLIISQNWKLRNVDKIIKNAVWIEFGCYQQATEILDFCFDKQNLGNLGR